MSKMIFAILGAGLLLFAGATYTYANLVIKDFVPLPRQPAGPSDGGVRATFANITGGVRLTMEILPSLYGGKVSEWGFNYSTASALTFKLESSSDLAEPTIVLGPNNLTKADGDGYYDFTFKFNTDAVNYFGSTGYTTVIYNILGSGVTIESFNLGSWDSLSRGKTRSGYDSAVHIQSMPAGGGGTWEAGNGSVVPIPATAWLLAAGLLGLVVVRRRMKK